jgi:threonine/homoserine/homoserine lactone efflux protein
MDEILRNVLLGITLAAPIGPAGVAVIQSGLRSGFQRAFLTGLGITTADLTYMLLVYLGLSSFISIPAVKVAIWGIGTLVLLYLGVQSIREGSRKIDFDPNAEMPIVAGSRNPYLVGYLVNISNPIAVVFWLGIFGSLITAGSGRRPGLEALIGGSSILAGILIWHTSMSILTHWGKRYVNNRTARVVSIVAGLALVGFGLRFGFNAISTLLTS